MGWILVKYHDLGNVVGDQKIKKVATLDSETPASRNVLRDSDDVLCDASSVLSSRHVMHLVVNTDIKSDRYIIEWLIYININIFIYIYRVSKNTRPTQKVKRRHLWHLMTENVKRRHLLHLMTY